MNRIFLIAVLSAVIVALVLYCITFKEYELPIDGSVVLADFYANSSGDGSKTPFYFGLATAPAHSEDHLEDSWIEWARDGRIPFFQDIPNAEMRLNAWSKPEIDIDLAASTGVTVLRMGVDWGRLVPFTPGSMQCDRDGLASFEQHNIVEPRKNACRAGIQNVKAMKHYVKTMEYINKKGMKIMLTLFHHSLPVWANDRKFRGWSNANLVNFFVMFVGEVVAHVKHLVDDYVVFNEPAVFANLVYGMSMWPGRLYDYPDTFAYWNALSLKGAVVKAYENMIQAHKVCYETIKLIDDIPAHRSGKMITRVGIAHYMSYNVPGFPHFIMKHVVGFINTEMNYRFPQELINHLDFMGINYYGKEVVTAAGAALLNTEEYSEAGRLIHPDGLYSILVEADSMLNLTDRQIPIVITENGISDSTDVLRPSYLIEHLLAVKKAQEKGLLIEGYVFWTLTDNWEWADGYCPKFGLYEVDRSSPQLHRVPRNSTNLFKEIVGSGNITLQQRVDSWNLVKNTHGLRPFCRAQDGRGTVQNETLRSFANVDWRVHYKLDHFPKKRRFPF
jgi:beta-glucosidase/6-phospho-beta-glucosidase/beta-galactosidase